MKKVKVPEVNIQPVEIKVKAEKIDKKKLLTKENIKKGIEIGKTVALVMAIVNLAKAVAVVVKETAEKTREERRKLEEERAGLELREPEEENAGQDR